MVQIDERGNITLPRGDTMTFTLTLENVSFPEGSVAVFAVRNGNETVLSKIFPIDEDNEIVVRVANSDTRDLPLGRYRWDVRLITNPEYDENNHIRAEDEGDDVISLFSGDMPKFILKEVAVDV